MSKETTNETKVSKIPAQVSLGTGVFAGIVAAALAIGALVCALVMGGGAAAGGALGKKTLTEAELGTTVATYSYGGKSQAITAREVIEQFGSLEASKDADGNYAIPTADNALSLARNKIIASEAENRGITVSDDDLASYAEETLGSSDFEQIASSYGMDVESVKSLLRQSSQMTKLRDEVVGTNDATAPQAPAEPEYATTNEEGNELSEEEINAARDEAFKKETKKYAKYIIGLAGDEWDSKKGTWKAEDGPFATALAGYKVTADGASYEAAQAAYSVAYQEYSNAQSEVSTKWTDFVNDLLANASISLNSLMS